LRGNLLQLGAEIAGGTLDANAAARDRRRAAGTHARRDLVGIALHDVHALRRQAELLGDELGIGGLVPLPARLRADQNGDVAIGIERDLGGLVGAHAAANLDIARQANAADEPLLLCELGALGKFLPARNLHRALHMRGEVTGVVDLVGRGLVGHLLRRDEVLAPDRIRRHAEFSRSSVGQTFDHVSCFRASGAAISVDRHGVGEHRADAAVKGLDVIEARQHAGAAMRDVGPEGREIRAHVSHQVDIHAEEFAVLGERHARHRDVVAALRIAHEMV
jgi:hypothetical protein